MIAVVPVASVLSENKAVPHPTAPASVVVPAVLSESAKAPFTVDAKLRFPDPVEVSVVAAPSVTGSL